MDPAFGYWRTGRLYLLSPALACLNLPTRGLALAADAGSACRHGLLSGCADRMEHFRCFRVLLQAVAALCAVYSAGCQGFFLGAREADAISISDCANLMSQLPLMQVAQA
jgi:hypothetical protein